MEEDTISGLRYQKFALVSYKEAKEIIDLEEMSFKSYTEALMHGYDEDDEQMELNIAAGVLPGRVMKLPMIEVSRNGTNVIFRDDLPGGKVLVETDTHRVEPYQRKGVVHGHWSFCPVKFSDLKLLTSIINKTFGNGGLFPNRSTARCFGHNTYSGQKGAPYVAPTIRMSSAAVTLSQFWRSSTDPTYVPVIMKVLNLLGSHAVKFQHCVDSVYYGFHKVCFSHLYKDAMKVPSSLQNSRGQMGHNRGECELTILTCGNNLVSGFSNTHHVDKGDIWSPSMQQLGKSNLDLYKEACAVNGVSEEMKNSMTHLSNLSKASVDGSFSSYTTCGYSLSFTPDNVSLVMCCFRILLLIFLISSFPFKGKGRLQGIFFIR